MKRRTGFLMLAIWVSLAANITGVGNGRAEELKGKIIALVTHPVASLGYTMGNILANTVTKHTPLRMDVEPTAGPKSWLPRGCKAGKYSSGSQVTSTYMLH